ncbi:MAG: HAMP domain-containing histidine kinase [Rhodobacteraceae bacterium]|nr:HAMP domain-containing histidine kinase [Paracoccaceae bacterium]
MIAAHMTINPHSENDEALKVDFHNLANRPRSSRNPEQVFPSALTLIAHDLRGPLATLRSMIELIEAYDKGARPEKIEAYTRRASGIIDGLDDFLNSILERTLKTGDPLKFEPTVLQLNEVLERAIENSQPTNGDTTVSLLNFTNETLLVLGDAQLLYQAIENLIGNAVKHSTSGTQVDCSLKQYDDKAVLSIQDRGTGLSRMDIQRAFKPFTTLSSKPAGELRSWGLGLWIVKLIVEQHGGDVSVASAGPGKGSTFTITLPLLADINQKQEKKPQARSPI